MPRALCAGAPHTQAHTNLAMGCGVLFLAFLTFSATRSHSACSRACTVTNWKDQPACVVMFTHPHT